MTTGDALVAVPRIKNIKLLIRFYARCILALGQNKEWNILFKITAVNAEILKIWSYKDLDYVKDMAWRIVSPPVRHGADRTKIWRERQRLERVVQ